jgi:hypothetical protein
MKNESDVLRDVSQRLDGAGIAFMLTGSLAMNYYAQPRMTRDVDVVIELGVDDTAKVVGLFHPDYYVSAEAVAESLRHRSMFNLIHNESIIKVDFVIRKDQPFRQEEFRRRKRIRIQDFDTWIVTKEDLILSKLFWARDSRSERQLTDVQNLIATECDTEYVTRWAKDLGVAELWKELAENE